MKKLIYVLDPLCGWCYGNGSNISAVANTFKNILEIEVVVGGMWVGNNAPEGGEGFSRFIAHHAPKMEKTTGTYVSSKFYELAKDSSYKFSSLEPSCAITLVKCLYPKKVLLFAKEVQKTIYTEGKRLDILETYVPILINLRIDLSTFKQHWLSQGNLRKTIEEFSDAKHLANGYPTLLLKDGDEFQPLATGYFNKEQIINQLHYILNNKNE